MEKEIEKLRDFFRDQEKAAPSLGKIWEKNRKFLASVIYSYRVWSEAFFQTAEGKNFVEHIHIFRKEFIDSEKHPIGTNKDPLIKISLEDDFSEAHFKRFLSPNYKPPPEWSEILRDLYLILIYYTNLAQDAELSTTVRIDSAMSRLVFDALYFMYEFDRQGRGMDRTAVPRGKNTREKATRLKKVLSIYKEISEKSPYWEKLSNSQKAQSIHRQMNEVTVTTIRQKYLPELRRKGLIP